MPSGAEHRGGGTLPAPRHQTSVGGFSPYSQSRSWPPRPAPRAAGPPAGSPCLCCGGASTRPLCAACTKDGRPRSHSCFRGVLSLAWRLGSRSQGRIVELPCSLWSCQCLYHGCFVEDRWGKLHSCPGLAHPAPSGLLAVPAERERLRSGIITSSANNSSSFASRKLLVRGWVSSRQRVPRMCPSASRKRCPCIETDRLFNQRWIGSKTRVALQVGHNQRRATSNDVTTHQSTARGPRSGSPIPGRPALAESPCVNCHCSSISVIIATGTN